MRTSRTRRGEMNEARLLTKSLLDELLLVCFRCIVISLWRLPFDMFVCVCSSHSYYLLTVNAVHTQYRRPLLTGEWNKAATWFNEFISFAKHFLNCVAGWCRMNIWWEENKRCTGIGELKSRDGSLRPTASHSSSNTNPIATYGIDRWNSDTFSVRNPCANANGPTNSSNRSPNVGIVSPLSTIRPEKVPMTKVNGEWERTNWPNSLW